MESSKYFLGVDGGGTRTTAIVSDIYGNIVTCSTGKTINYYAAGLETARANMKEIMEDIQEKSGIDYFDAANIGMSALYREAMPEEKQAFADGIISASEIYMTSDLHIAMEGVSAEGPCILIISGTGSMAVARDWDGNSFVVGGWGYAIGDQGSGYYIAMEAIKHVLKSYDGLERPTAMLGAFMEYYGLAQLRDAIDIFHSPAMHRDKIPAFAGEVYKCALNNDQAAGDIIKKAANELAECVFALMEKIREKNVAIGVYGGVFQHNKILYEEFCGIVHEKAEAASIGLLKYPPEVGAIFGCFKKNNLPIHDEIIYNIKKTYLTRKV
jgi:glucosamine kinase